MESSFELFRKYSETPIVKEEIDRLESKNLFELEMERENALNIVKSLLQKFEWKDSDKGLALKCAVNIAVSRELFQKRMASEIETIEGEVLNLAGCINFDDKENLFHPDFIYTQLIGGDEEAVQRAREEFTKIIKRKNDIIEEIGTKDYSHQYTLRMKLQSMNKLMRLKGENSLKKPDEYRIVSSVLNRINS